MFTRYRGTYRDVRRSYTQEKARREAQEEWLAYRFFRPLSFFVTPLFIQAGFSANGVTALAIFIGVTLPFVAATNGSNGYLAIVGLMLFLQVLDCVDGNIARTTGRRSILGAMLDGVATQAYWVGFMAAVGFAARAQSTDWFAHHGGEIGLALALLFILRREMDGTYRHYFGNMIQAVEAPTTGETEPRPISLYSIAKSAEQPVAIGGLLALGFLHELWIFLAGLVAYELGVWALWLPRQIQAIRRRSAQRDPRD